MNEKSNVCVVYCRVSSDRQAAEDKGSLDDQEARCRAKAQALGLTILRVQRDAESAWVLDKRSQFQAVLKDARAGKFDVLVVDRMNRFVRGEDMADYMALAVALREAGVKVVFAEKDYGSGAASQLMQYLDAYVSAGEQANRRKQIMGGKRTRVLAPSPHVARESPDVWLPLGGRGEDARRVRGGRQDGTPPSHSGLCGASGNTSSMARVQRYREPPRC